MNLLVGLKSNIKEWGKTKNTNIRTRQSLKIIESDWSKIYRFEEKMFDRTKQ